LSHTLKSQNISRTAITVDYVIGPYNTARHSAHTNGHLPAQPGTRMSPFWILLELKMTEMVVWYGIVEFNVPFDTV